MKLYRVLLINAAERSPISEVVYAESETHALNHILNVFGVKVNYFNIVQVEEWKLVAEPEHNHNKCEFVFDDCGKLIGYKEHQDNKDLIISIDIDGVTHNINLGDNTTFTEACMRSEGYLNNEN